MLKIGVVGAGQLCRMFGEEIRKKNINVALIAIDPSSNPPAKEFLDKHIIGDFKDYFKIVNLANEVDILTFEIELANFEALEFIEKIGKKVYPSSFVLKNIQDKYIQYEFLKKNNIPVPESINLGKNLIVDNDNFETNLDKLGYPLILKKRKDSYDGRGNFILKNKDKLSEALNYFGDKEMMAQRFINFNFEISVVGCRWLDSSITNFPLCFNIHGKDYNILDKTFVINENYISEGELIDFFNILSSEENKYIKPLDKDNFIRLKEKAYKIAYDVINSFNSYGVLTVEMMVEIEGNKYNKIGVLDNNFIKVFVNEIAPRVHNSGHYTIESCNISQFEAHIRSIMGENKIEPFLKNKFACMLNIYGGKEDNGRFDLIYNENIKINNNKNNKNDNDKNKESQKIINGTVEIEEGVFVHNYMKEEVRPYRKIGHITILGKENESMKEFYERVLRIREKVRIQVKDK